MLLLHLGPAFCFSQTGIIGMQGKLSDDGQYIRVEGKTPGLLFGLEIGDRITKINDIPVSELTNWHDHIKGEPGTFVKLEVERFCNKTVTISDIPRVLIRNEKCVTEEQYISIGIGDSQKFISSMSVLHDKSRDMFRYKTYDFEYTSQNDPLLEKELFRILGGQLDAKGMTRKQEDPDLLIVMTFFEGTKEQYVPPQQIISSKIEKSYNIFWGYIPVALTESQSTPGYTDITYINSFAFKCLDAKEIGTSNVPPVVWSGSRSFSTKEKISLIDSCNIHLSWMMLQFPETWDHNSERGYTRLYPYTGLIFNLDNTLIIEEIVPNSPAFKAGLKKGDKILSINGIRLPVKYGYNFQYLNKSGENADDPVQFKVKREGKTIKIDVTPVPSGINKLY